MLLAIGENGLAKSLFEDNGRNSVSGILALRHSGISGCKPTWVGLHVPKVHNVICHTPYFEQSAGRKRSSPLIKVEIGFVLKRGECYAFSRSKAVFPY